MTSSAGADVVVAADPFSGAVVTDVTRAAGIGREGGRDVGDGHRACLGSGTVQREGGWNNSWAVRVAEPSPDWLRLPWIEQAQLEDAFR